MKSKMTNVSKVKYAGQPKRGDRQKANIPSKMTDAKSSKFAGQAKRGPVAKNKLSACKNNTGEFNSAAGKESFDANKCLKAEIAKSKARSNTLEKDLAKKHKPLAPHRGVKVNTIEEP